MRSVLRRAALLGPLERVRRWRQRRGSGPVAADCRAFEARWGDLLARRRAAAPPRDGRRALVVGLHGFVPSAKLDGAIALSLRDRACEPVALVPEGCGPWFRRYYELFGVEAFATLEAHGRPSDAGTVARALEPFLAGRIALRDLLDLEYRGVEIGRHALSWVVRTLHAGEIDLDAPALRERLRETLTTAMLTVHRAERLLEDVRPDVLVFNERGYTPYGELFDAALRRDVPCVQWVGCHRDDALQVKRYTFATRHRHPSSFGTEAWERIRRMPIPGEVLDDFLARHRRRYETGDWYQRQDIQTGKPVLPREEAMAALGLDPGRPTAVVFSHILWDATFFYGTSLFEDYATWLVETVRAACRNPRANWVVKLHPANVWRRAVDGYEGELAEVRLFRERVGELPDHVRLLMPDTPLNTASLFELADCGVTVRGTIGMEMPMYGVPVVTAGTGRYAGLGFTIDPPTAEAYRERLASIETVPRLSEAEVQLARRHGHALFELRPLVLEGMELDWQVEAPPGAPAVWPEPERWEHGVPEGLRRLAGWILDDASEDFLGGLEGAVGEGTRTEAVGIA